MDSILLKVENLQTSFLVKSGEVKAANEISFTLKKGEALGIVGESGSGKSVTAYSILQILQNPGKIVGGSIALNGQELVNSGESVMSRIRGNKISMIFQDPMTSLNPVFTVGNQLTEAIMLHTKRRKAQARERSVELLRLVGINEPKRRVKQYPHELSGGMRQRAMIAMAIACEPDILIADEPTTALDVTVQAQILELMKSLQEQLGMAIIMITHDLGVIAGMCERVIVMYAGRIVESGTVDEIFYAPAHEYTKGLLKSIPSISDERQRLIPIAGSPVDMLSLPKGCAFAPRCDCAMKICLASQPAQSRISETHSASCWMNEKGRLENA
ncbi:MAG: ABC transporter ATP-binding protein [Eubacteriaceae bacterium]|nr:ABC transporter ATP-binding protein [Eubacteriaceae bacterium]